MGKLLPILMLLVGVGAGIGAGLVLAPAEEPHAEEGEDHAEAGGEDHGEEGRAEDKDAKDHGEDAAKPPAKKPKPEKKADDGHSEGEEVSTTEFVKINNQFVVPVVASGRVEALVVLTLSLETALGLREVVYNREPKLRDAFLQVLFDHSNMGGFQGAFTRSNNLDILRGALLDVAQREFGYDVLNVLIVDIARQDV